MKRALQRSLLIFVVAVAFLGGLGYFTYSLIVNSSDWVDQAYNGHISGNGGLEQAGSIYDRNGVLLAQTVDGKRIYHEDEATRKALLHVIGDDSLNISTAVQSMYRSELTGYNFLWGVGVPESLKIKHDINLTIDAETCRVAYEGFNGRDGACVIYNYETGEVICSVSTKAYDPQAPPTITKENEDEYEGVYLDNVLSSSYIPGSIFKIVTAAAAYENIPDIESRTFYCEQEKEIGGSDVTCMEYHGEMTFKEAMACSCNIVFADLAVELGQDKMTQTANKMGINSSFNISGVNTAKGRYDVSKANTNQLAWSGVGQYNDLVNPMQMAVICGSIANGGKTKMPYIMDDATSFLSDMGIPLPGKMSDELVSPQTAEKLKEIMRYTISDYYGDGMFGGLTVCAKTGPGETGEGKEPNAWMVGFSIDEDCPLAFAVVVEHGGIGYSNAGPIASSALIQAAKSLGSKAVG